jgi:hypothetical protein
MKEFRESDLLFSETIIFFLETCPVTIPFFPSLNFMKLM